MNLNFKNAENLLPLHLLIISATYPITIPYNDLKDVFHIFASSDKDSEKFHTE